VTLDFTAPEAPEQAQEPPRRRLKVTRASEVVARRLRWLWDLRIVLGGLTLLAGREGLGKSTVAVWLAALVTRGQLDGELKGQPRTVIYCNSEDARDYTIRPRLEAAGADLDRVIFVDAVMPGEEGEEHTESIILPRDALLLAELARDEDAAMVILDAATSVIDQKLDGDKDRQMRQGLEAIGRVVGEGSGSAVLGIVHFGKRDSNDTGKLILGSIAWSQVARSVLAVAQDEENSSLVISRTKGNLGLEPPSLAVQIVSATVPTPEGDTYVGRVELIGETDQDARALLAASEVDPEDRTDRDTAAEWLRGYLVDNGGQAKASEVVRAAAAAEVPGGQRTLQRARKKAGVTTRRVGDGWVWTIEEQGDTSRRLTQGVNLRNVLTSEDVKATTDTHVRGSCRLDALTPREPSGALPLEGASAACSGCGTPVPEQGDVCAPCFQAGRVA
jgi:energy-coupling factor transporter ATP-binding protein EcfA2